METKTCCPLRKMRVASLLLLSRLLIVSPGICCGQQAPLTASPSCRPSTLLPTSHPSKLPSLFPSTKIPTFKPTRFPSTHPTFLPSKLPSYLPSKEPSSNPSNCPSIMPSISTSSLPSTPPSNEPSRTPTDEPSQCPSIAPTNTPTSEPSQKPSFSPSTMPSYIPSYLPSLNPSRMPSAKPTLVPTIYPTLRPTLTPTIIPTNTPTSLPTASYTFTQGYIVTETYQPVSKVLVHTDDNTLPSECTTGPVYSVAVFTGFCNIGACSEIKNGCVASTTVVNNIQPGVSFSTTYTEYKTDNCATSNIIGSSVKITTYVLKCINNVKSMFVPGNNFNDTNLPINAGGIISRYWLKNQSLGCTSTPPNTITYLSFQYCMTFPDSLVPYYTIVSCTGSGYSANQYGSGGCLSTAVSSTPNSISGCTTDSDPISNRKSYKAFECLQSFAPTIRPTTFAPTILSDTLQFNLTQSLSNLDCSSYASSARAQVVFRQALLRVLGSHFARNNLVVTPIATKCNPSTNIILHRQRLTGSSQPVTSVAYMVQFSMNTFNSTLLQEKKNSIVSIINAAISTGKLTTQIQGIAANTQPVVTILLSAQAASPVQSSALAQLAVTSLSPTYGPSSPPNIASSLLFGSSDRSVEIGVIVSIVIAALLICFSIYVYFRWPILFRKYQNDNSKILSSFPTSLRKTQAQKNTEAYLKNLERKNKLHGGTEPDSENFDMSRLYPSGEPAGITPFKSHSPSPPHSRPQSKKIENSPLYPMGETLSRPSSARVLKLSQDPFDMMFQQPQQPYGSQKPYGSGSRNASSSSLSMSLDGSMPMGYSRNVLNTQLSLSTSMQGSLSTSQKDSLESHSSRHSPLPDIPNDPYALDSYTPPKPSSNLRPTIRTVLSHISNVSSSIDKHNKELKGLHNDDEQTFEPGPKFTSTTQVQLQSSRINSNLTKSQRIKSLSSSYESYNQFSGGALEQFKASLKK